MLAQRVNKIIPGLLLGLLGVVFSLVLFELCFRLWQYAAAKQTVWSDRPKRYFIHEQSRSFQDYPYSIPKTEGAFRIAVVGDSFSFGPYLQFDDTFPKRLERWLNLNSPQTPVQVINYGVPRYSTSHEVAVTKRALEEGADLILLQITLNDPEIKPYRPTGLDSRSRDRFATAKVQGGIYDYWHSLAFVMGRIENSRSVESYQRYFEKLYVKKNTWKGFSKSLSEIAASVKERNVPLLAVVFPLFGFQNDSDYPFHWIHAKVEEELRAQGVGSIDLFEAYRGIPLERLIVMPGVDRHPNEIAHRIAAEALYEWLIGLNVIPDSALARETRTARVGTRLR